MLRTLKDALRRAFRSAGLDLIRYGRAAPGTDPFADMQRLTRAPAPVVFDVGANVGQSVRAYRAAFPASVVHSFEPGPATFEVLRASVSGLARVHLSNCALGATAGRLTFHENRLSDMSSFLPMADTGYGEVVADTEVRVCTVDDYCAEHRIGRIDILKSDTQGFDLEVLRGTDGMLSAGRVGLVYLEVSFADVLYRGLPSFGAIYDYLMERGFRMASIYKIRHHEGLANWGDALFVHGVQRPSSVGRVHATKSSNQ
jgi:FkbM family methyltransferase